MQMHVRRAAPGLVFRDAARANLERKLHTQLRGTRRSDDIDWLAKVRLVNGIEIVLPVVRMIGEVEYLEQAFQARAIRDPA